MAHEHPHWAHAFIEVAAYTLQKWLVENNYVKKMTDHFTVAMATRFWEALAMQVLEPGSSYTLVKHHGCLNLA